MSESFEAMVEAARACIKTKREVGGSGSKQPRFDSFHAPASICSEKVRCVLLYKRAHFTAHEVDLARQENYQPAYVALRNLGREGRPLVGQHAWTGSTATQQVSLVIV